MSGQKSDSLSPKTKLFSRSPIHGFGFILDSETKIERIAWYSCMAVSLVFLTLDTYRLYNQYLNYVGTSYTKLTMNSGDTPAQVPMDACFEFNLIDLRNMLSENFSAKTFYLGEQWDENLNETTWNRMRLISEQGTSENDEGEIDLYLYIILTYFQRMFNWEDSGGIVNPYLSVTEQEDKDWRRFLVNNQFHHDMVQIESAAQYWNVTPLKLLRELSTSMLYLFGGDTEDEELKNPGMFIFMSNIYNNDIEFCYRFLLPKPEKPIMSLYKGDRGIHSGRIPNKEIYVDFRQVKSMVKKFTIKLLDADAGYGILDVNAGEEKTIVIDLNSVSVSRPKQNKQCSDDGLLLHECRLKCQIEAIEDVCKCTPFLDQLLSNNPNKSICSYGEYYRECLQPIERQISKIWYTKVPDNFIGDRLYEIDSEDFSNHEFKLPAENRHVKNLTKLFYNNTKLDSLECQRKCLPSCTKRIWTMIEQTIIPSKVSSFAKAILQFRSTTYPVFEEVPYPMEFQNFISSVGGNMGVWFGASFLSIIHIAIYVVRYVVMKIKKNEVLNFHNLRIADIRDRQIAKVVYADSIGTS